MVGGLKESQLSRTPSPLASRNQPAEMVDMYISGYLRAGLLTFYRYDIGTKRPLFLLSLFQSEPICRFYYSRPTRKGKSEGTTFFPIFTFGEMFTKTTTGKVS